MSKMFYVCSIWTGIFATMFFVGDLNQLAIIFLAQCVTFGFLGVLELTERMYIYIFATYLVICFVAFVYYSTFLLVPGFD